MTRKLYLRASECVKHFCIGIVLEGETVWLVLTSLEDTAGHLRALSLAQNIGA
jgi:hypothetical protein